ncbi:MAG: aspartate carbamoyltransferase [Bacteroidetes bacterium HGW-Bacteroidetes-6]|jgi:aspartate carbamoyltransferase catalytic subunit|nr:MAG: aspartate carbamoyltransferase [Bacteroidetes bacterium HGW-Bacteroidetes-6]
MKRKSLVSINDYSKEEILEILELAKKFEEKPNRNLLDGIVVGVLFFEPSTRTRLSFEAAIQRMGGRVIGFSEAGSTSVQKGESLKDTIQTVNQYADLIVMRHPVEGSARYASEVASIPVINAGDGANQHPTQCLLDLYTIQQTQNTLDNLNMTFVGDLKYGRTVHSLSIAMTMFNTTFHLVSPFELKLPSAVKMHIKEKNLPYHQYTKLDEAIPLSDIIYMTRIQAERFSDPMEYERVKNSYVLNSELLANSKPGMKVLHPLPRVNEISTDVDDSPQAYYFKQAQNGMFVREALIAYMLGLKV